MLKKFYIGQCLLNQKIYGIRNLSTLIVFDQGRTLFCIDELHGRDDILKTLQTIQINQLAKTA